MVSYLYPFKLIMRFYLSILLFLLLPFVGSAANGLDYKILKIADRVFYNTHKPTIKVAVYNNHSIDKFSGSVVCRVEKYNGEHVFDFSQDFFVTPMDSSILSFTFGLEKGFYRVSLIADDVVKEKVVMAYEPELTGSSADPHFDAERYYGAAFVQLERLPMSSTFEKVKKTGGKLRNVYEITVKSIGGKTFEGYFVAPKKSGVYPVVITCTDKNEVLAIPEIDAYSDRIDLVISPRRALIHNDNYFISAYVDIIRAIDFVYGRKDVDLKNICLQGVGSGGAMVLAAAALDKRVAAVSVYAPGYSNESVLDKVKHYEAKHLSGQIECPVIMGVGLEDTVCTPIDNFEIYNPIKGRKEYYIFIQDHCPPAEWREITDNFYLKHKR